MLIQIHLYKVAVTLIEINLLFMSKLFELFNFSYLKYKKEKILNFDPNNESNNSNSVVKIAEAILEDGGTATK
jgi:hypothetical protein